MRIPGNQHMVTLIRLLNMRDMHHHRLSHTELIQGTLNIVATAPLCRNNVNESL